VTWGDAGASIPGRAGAAHDNGRVAAHGARVAAALAPALVLLTGCAALLAGCGGGDGAAATPSTSVSAPGISPRSQLAGLAARAKDRKYSAVYTLNTPNRPARNVTVALATDGGWRLDVPDAALGGSTDVSLVSVKDGVYQCTGATCVRVAGAKAAVPVAVDLRIQHPFTDWLEPLTDPDVALSVAPAPLLQGARGACYDIRRVSAAIASPVDAGVYCYDTEGIFTGARLGFGTLVISGTPAAAPASITLPGPVVNGAPLPLGSS